MWKGVIVRRRKLGRSSAKGITSFSQTGMDWYRSDKKAKEGDVYIRWGCTAPVAGNKVLNTAEAIHEVADKKAFRLKLSEAGLSPLTFDDYNDLPGNIRFPLVVRRGNHAQGRNLHVVSSFEELKTTCDQYGHNYYISPLVNKVAEYRVTFVQGRVVWVAEKTPADRNVVAWNVAQGGRFDNVSWGQWPLRAVRKSLEAFMLSSLDFGAVDVMVDENGDCFVLEINSAPSQTSPYRQECMAKAFDYIMQNESKERIPVVQQRGDWKKFIHPALSPMAIMEEE